MAKKSAAVRQEVTFITGTGIASGTGVELHSKQGEKVVKSITEVKEDYDAIIKQINLMIADSDDNVKASGFKLDEITLGLGFSASGGIGFIAQAGVEASIQVTFKRV